MQNTNQPTNRFGNFQEVDLSKKEFPTRWNTENSPKEFVGTFKGIRVVTMSDGSSFEVLEFINCYLYPSNAKLGDYDVRAYAVLKRKLQGLEGRNVGVAYLGLDKHPKTPTKTIHNFAVYLIDSPKTNDDLPF
jgi:hypothetical protein